MVLRPFTVCVFALALAGCAIHPLPEDVTGYRTSDIVKHVRCEARRSVLYELTKYLRTRNNDGRAQEVLLQIENRSPPIKNINYDHFSAETQPLIEKFRKTAIAYNFTFDMTENNKAGVTVDLLHVFTGGVLSASVGASDDRMRENIRSFTVADTFEDLIKKIDDRYCDGNVENANFQYPIAGKIGVDEMVDTFVHLSLFDGLGGPENNRKGPPTMADTIAFTTTVSGSVNPKVVLSPVRHGLTDAIAMTSVSRQDLHKVIVGLSLPDPKDAEKSGVTKDPRRTLPSTLITAQGTSAELNAALAIQQQIYRFDLRNATIIFNGSGALVN